MEIFFILVVLFIYARGNARHKALCNEYNDTLAHCCLVINECGTVIDRQCTLIERLIHTTPTGGGSSIEGVEPGDIYAARVDAIPNYLKDSKVVSIASFTRKKADAT